MKSMNMWAEVADSPFPQQPKHISWKETACGRAHDSRPQVSIRAWEILGNLPGPWFFPFGKDKEITCLGELL
jgi:hypothetical protein